MGVMTRNFSEVNLEIVAFAEIPQDAAVITTALDMKVQLEEAINLSAYIFDTVALDLRSRRVQEDINPTGKATTPGLDASPSRRIPN